MVITQGSAFDGLFSLADIVSRVSMRTETASLKHAAGQRIAGHHQNKTVTRKQLRDEFEAARREWLGNSFRLPDSRNGQRRTALRAKHFAKFLKDVARDLNERGLLKGGELPILAAIRHIKETPHGEVTRSFG